MDLKKIATILALIMFGLAMFGVTYVDLSTGVFQPAWGIFVTKDQSPLGFWIFTFASFLLGVAALWWAHKMVKQSS